MTVNSIIPQDSWTQVTATGGRCKLTACRGSLWWRIAASNPGTAVTNGHFLATRESFSFDGGNDGIGMGSTDAIWVRPASNSLTEIAVDRGLTYGTNPALP